MNIDMETAVPFVTNAIQAGKTSLFVSTEFGTIAIETNPKGYIPEGSIEVNTWENASPTKWAMRHSDKRNIEFHVIITPGRTEYCTKSRVISALSKCMLMHIFQTEVSDGEVDAASKVYMETIEGHIPTTNFLEKEYADNNMSTLVKGSVGVCNLIREVIVLRDTEAVRILEEGEKLSRTEGNGWDPTYIRNFVPGYETGILYIILYLARKYNRRLDMGFHLQSNPYMIPEELLNSSCVVGTYSIECSTGRFIQL